MNKEQERKDIKTLGLLEEIIMKAVEDGMSDAEAVKQLDYLKYEITNSSPDNNSDINAMRDKWLETVSYEDDDKDGNELYMFNAPNGDLYVGIRKAGTN
jgi:hypothetical protein